eukprot:312024-Amphidinium_carterae.1
MTPTPMISVASQPLHSTTSPCAPPGVAQTQPQMPTIQYQPQMSNAQDQLQMVNMQCHASTTPMPQPMPQPVPMPSASIP